MIETVLAIVDQMFYATGRRHPAVTQFGDKKRPELIRLLNSSRTGRGGLTDPCRLNGKTAGGR